MIKKKKIYIFRKVNCDHIVFNQISKVIKFSSVISVF